jgi:eukaryotic-like serine/threonine-protein kinase
LILGDAGGGKTTTLIGLAQEFLEAADRNRRLAFPVILNLSTWSSKFGTLLQWLIDEFHERYDVAEVWSTKWLKEGRFLLFLDGLDEVTHALRVNCVKAINDYGEPKAGIVVSSRIEEYVAVSKATTTWKRCRVLHCCLV